MLIYMPRKFYNLFPGVVFLLSTLFTTVAPTVLTIFLCSLVYTYCSVIVFWRIKNVI